MNIRSIMLSLLMLGVLNTQTTNTAYITEIINNTDLEFFIQYNTPDHSLKILDTIALSSIHKNKQLLAKKLSSPTNTTIVLPRRSLTKFNAMHIPNAQDDPHGYRHHGLNVGPQLSHSKMIPFALIRQKNNWIELTHKTRYFSNSEFSRISSDTRFSEITSPLILEIKQLSDHVFLPTETGDISLLKKEIEVTIKNINHQNNKNQNIDRIPKNAIQISDEYYVTELPENMYTVSDRNVLNNHGQIAGFIQQNKKTFLSPIARPRLVNIAKDNDNCNAIIWDAYKGIYNCPLKGNNRSFALNDHNFVAISNNHNNHAETIIWDVTTNELKNLGINPSPYNEPKMINNKNILLMSDGSVWDFICNMKPNIPNTYNGFPAISISDANQLCPWLGLGMHYLDFNKKGTALAANYSIPAQLYLQFPSKTLLAITFEHELNINPNRLKTSLPAMNARINDNDTVVAILKINNKSEYAIGMQTKDSSQIIIHLKDIPILNKYTCFEIVGFNNKQQILIQATNEQLHSSRLFLFTPSNNNH